MHQEFICLRLKLTFTCFSLWTNYCFVSESRDAFYFVKNVVYKALLVQGKGGRTRWHDDINISKDSNFWRFNSSLIPNTTFLEQMKSFIKKTKADLVKDNSLFEPNKWEYLKCKVCNFTIAFSKGLAKNSRNFRGN